MIERKERRDQRTDQQRRERERGGRTRAGVECLKKI